MICQTSTNITIWSEHRHHTPKTSSNLAPYKAPVQTGFVFFPPKRCRAAPHHAVRSVLRCRATFAAAVRLSDPSVDPKSFFRLACVGGPTRPIPIPTRPSRVGAAPRARLTRGRSPYLWRGAARRVTLPSGGFLGFGLSGRGGSAGGAEHAKDK